MLPFSSEQFFALFGHYNLAIWPAQLVAYALAVFLVWSVVTRRTWNWRATAFILGAFWLWNGLVYHLTYFTGINPAAYGFAALFVAQGIAFIGSGIRAPDATITIQCDACSIIAATLILYAMVVYSIIGTLVGHGWPRAPMFGIAPCPTTIFTLAVLMLARQSSSFWLAAIPIVWALIGATAAVLLGVSEDLGLVASVAALAACRWKGRKI